MRILHITQFYHPLKGYQENNLARISRRKGDAVSIITSDDLSIWGVKENRHSLLEEFKNIENSDVDLIRLKKRKEIFNRILLKSFFRTLKENKSDVYYFHGATVFTTLLGLLYLLVLDRKAKIIVDDHMVDAGVRNRNLHFFFGIIKLYYKAVKFFLDIRFIAVSEETQNYMKVNYGLDLEEIELIPLGINLKSLNFDLAGGQKWLKANRIPFDKEILLYIGKIDERKDPSILIDALSVLRKIRPNLILLFVGEMVGDIKERFYSKIVSLDLDDLVFFAPPVDNRNINLVFSIADVTVWPKGSSMSMLEAMAVGCPVVASKMDVNLERLSNHRGVIFDQGDLDGLVNSILIAIDKRGRIVQNAKEWVSGFDWEDLESETFDIYRVS